jgi:hypothetical protein
MMSDAQLGAGGHVVGKFLSFSRLCSGLANQRKLARVVAALAARCRYLFGGVAIYTLRIG